MIEEHSNWDLLLLNYIYCNIEGGEDTWIVYNNPFWSSNPNLLSVLGNISTVLEKLSTEVYVW